MPYLTDRTKLPNVIDPAIRDTMDLKHLYQVCLKQILESLLVLRFRLTSCDANTYMCVGSSSGGFVRAARTEL